MHANRTDETLALLSLGALWRRSLQFGAKHPIPEPTSDTKAILEIGIVVLQVVLLQFLVVEWKAG